MVEWNTSDIFIQVQVLNGKEEFYNDKNYNECTYSSIYNVLLKNHHLSQVQF